MGTVFQVEVRTEDTPGARRAIDAAFTLFDGVERTMSEWRPDSMLSELNRQAGKHPVPVSDDLMTVLVESQRIAEASDGAFDVTWAALRGLWRFDGDERIPDAAEIAKRLPLVGWRDLVLDPTEKTAFLRREGMAVGLGGIAKGYALDLAAAELRQRGFQHFTLNAGGQFYVGGDNGRDGHWRIGARHPRGGEDDYFAVLKVRDASVSTSGDYEHCFIKNGVRYHHIIDLKTGWPSRASVSVTTVAPTGLLADACDTAAFILGPKDALSFARKMGVELILVEPGGRVLMSEGMKRYVASIEPLGNIGP